MILIALSTWPIHLLHRQCLCALSEPEENSTEWGQPFHAAKFLAVSLYNITKDAHNECPEWPRHSWAELSKCCYPVTQIWSWCSKEKLRLEWALAIGTQYSRSSDHPYRRQNGVSLSLGSRFTSFLGASCFLPRSFPIMQSQKKSMTMLKGSTEKAP